MRVLLFAPLATAKIARPIVEIADAVRNLGHDIQIITRPTTRVQTVNGPVLSKNSANIERLQRKIGQGRVMLLHSHFSRKPSDADSIPEQIDLRRIQNWAELYCPEVVILGDIEDVSRDPAVLSVLNTIPPAVAALYLRKKETDDHWHLVNNKGESVLHVLREPKALQKSLHSALFSKGVGQSSQALDTVLKQNAHRIAALHQPNRPVISPKATITVKAVDSNKAPPPIRGGLESPQDGEVVFGKQLRIKGWLDCSPAASIREIEVLINDQSYSTTPNTIRGDVADRIGNPDIFGFEIYVPLGTLGPSLKIALVVVHKNGKKQVWQRQQLWANDCIPERHEIPILLGAAEVSHPSNALSGAEPYELHGNIRVAEHAIHAVVALQNGKVIAKFPECSTQPLSSELQFYCSLSPDFDPNAPLDLWVDLKDEGRVHWLRCSLDHENEAIATFPIGGLVSGDIVRGDSLPITVGPLESSENLMVFLNGDLVGEVNNADHVARTFDLDIPVASADHDLQLRFVTNKRANTIQLWRHVDTPLGCDPRPIIAVPQISTVNRKPSINAQSTQQHVVLIRKAASPTDELYILAPFQELLGKGILRLTIVDLDTDEENSIDADTLLASGTAVVVSRYISERWITAITRHKARLGPIFYLMDDDVAAAIDSHRLPGGYRQRMTRVAGGEFRTMIRLCDRFIVTSPHLFQRYQSLKTDLLEPPYLHPPRDMKHLDKEGPIVITYQGTEGHRDDLAAISPALREIHDAFPNVRLQIIIGNLKFIPALLKGLERIEAFPPMQWHEYKIFRNRARAHIGLAPILDTPYNRGKSIVKFYDISALGAVGVYTNSAPYNEVIDHGANGLLVDNDPQMWSKALRWLVQRPEEIRRMAKNGQLHAHQRGSHAVLRNYWHRHLFPAQPHV